MQRAEHLLGVEQLRCENITGPSALVFEVRGQFIGVRLASGQLVNIECGTNYN